MNKTDEYELLVKKELIKFPAELSKIAGYSPTCSMNSELDHLIRQFKKMSSRYKYAYRCVDEIEKHSVKKGWYVTDKSERYIFTNLKPDYEIITRPEEYPIVLIPDKYDNKKLLQCLEEMKTTGLSIDVYEKIKNELLKNKFKFNYLKKIEQERFIERIIKSRDDKVNILYTEFVDNLDYDAGPNEFELIYEEDLKVIFKDFEDEKARSEKDFEKEDLLEQHIEDELKMRYILYGEIYKVTLNSFIYFYKTNSFENEDFENNKYREKFKLKRMKIEDKFWIDLENSYIENFILTKDIRLKILLLKSFSWYKNYTEIEELKFLNEIQQWNQYHYNKTFQYELPHRFKELNYRDKEYKRIFNIYRKAGYSKWQVQQIMKKYIKYVNKYFQLQEELNYEFKNYHFEDSDELQINNGFGYFRDGADFDEEAVAEDIRLQYYYDLQMELEHIGYGIDEAKSYFENRFNEEQNELNVSKSQIKQIIENNSYVDDFEEDDECPF